MNTQNVSTIPQQKLLTIIFFAIATEQIVIAAAIYFLKTSGHFQGELPSKEILTIVFLAASAMLPFLGHKLYGWQMASTASVTDAVQATRKKFVTILLRLISYDMASILAMIGYLLTSNVVLLAAFVVIFAFYLFLKPKEESL